MNYLILGDIVKKKRKSLKMTQQTLADSVNITRQTVSKIEQGSLGSGISLLIFIKILESLNLEFEIKEKTAFDFDL